MTMIPRARLATARLILRPLSPEDAGPLAAALNDLAVSRWLSVVPYPYAVADAHWFIAEGQGGLGQTWAIEDAAGLAGVMGLGRELGYWLAPRAQGRGYATEAARAVLAAHFADAAAGPVRSAHFDGNARSAGVLRKLGFGTAGFRVVVPKSTGVSVLSRHVRLTREDYARANPFEVETPRLRIAPLDPDRDWRDLARIGGQDGVARMMSSVPSPWAQGVVRDWIAAGAWRGHVGFRLGLWLRGGPMIGSLGLGGQPVSVGYFLDPDHWGRGYATEAMQAFLAQAIPRFDLTEVVADHFADNPASGAVLRKLGFVAVGHGTGESAARQAPAANVHYRLQKPYLRA
jgi:RimJ/RimL family protein N-acetyltransferase